MLGIYFSGTGNTKYCIEKFLEYYDGSKPLSIESPVTIEALQKSHTIVFGYPIYYSDTPKIVKDFIHQNGTYFKNKEIFIICTMALFSGDGAGCGARLLKKCGAKIIGGLHLRMPDCIGDVKLLKRPLEQNRQLVRHADKKIIYAVDALKQGKPTKDGLSLFNYAAGFLGQRLWFYSKTKSYTHKLKINQSKCIGCGKCATLCPMKNLAISGHKAVSQGKCTMCYRCISHCPQKAITLLGREVVEQSLIEHYL